MAQVVKIETSKLTRKKQLLCGLAEVILRAERDGNHVLASCTADILEDTVKEYVKLVNRE